MIERRPIFSRHARFHSGVLAISLKSSEAAELANIECLDIDIMIHHEDTGLFSPNHGEVSISTQSPLEGKAIVITEKDPRVLKHSPMAKAVLMQPN